MKINFIIFLTIMYKMKKEVSYRELMEIVMRDIKEKNNKSGNKFEAKDAMREVADEWKKVKAGQHPEYIAKVSGSASTKTAPTKPSVKTSVKTSPKETDNASPETHTPDNTDALLREIIELCEKCKQKALQALTSKNTEHTKKTRKTRKNRK
jgi:hypothetical protein